MVFCGHPRRWLFNWDVVEHQISLRPLRGYSSLFIIFVSMEDSCLIGAFGSMHRCYLYPALDIFRGKSSVWFRAASSYFETMNDLENII